jgi:pimeloyl-ACP methyl ester carboxylesterase
MDDESLRAYVNGIACPAEHGFKLCYSVEWEMHIYATSMWHDMDLWHDLPRLSIPLMIIRGEETDTFWAATARLVQRKLPHARVVTIPRSTHLVPLERPAEVYNVTHDFLQEIL